MYSYSLSQFMLTIFQVLAAKHGIGKLLATVGFYSIEIDSKKPGWIFSPREVKSTKGQFKKHLSILGVGHSCSASVVQAAALFAAFLVATKDLTKSPW